jgi:hypothetical protein
VLNQAMALRAGMDFESLLTDRILRPLHMDDTRLSLTPELESRLAPEHSKLGYAMTTWHGEDFKPLAGLYSTANDLLKLLSACGLSSSYLRPLWDKTVANFAFAPQRAGMLHTGGGWFVNGCYLGFDKARRRGVVVLANSYELRRQLGNLLLESEWQSDRRSQPAEVSSQLRASYAGQYRRSPGFSLGTFVIRQYLLDAPRTATLLPAGICLAGLALRYHGKIFKYDKTSDGPPKATEPLKPPVIVKLDTDRLDACAGRYEVASGAMFPESETNFFEKLAGGQFRFIRNNQGQVTAVTHHCTGATLAWFPDWEAKKVSALVEPARAAPRRRSGRPRK